MKYDITPQQQNVIKNWLGSGSINLFGPQYAGKDTQGNYLVRTFSAAPLLGGGDILRNSVIPDHAKEIMNKGELFPTKDYLEIVLPYLSQPNFANKPLILSAVGRWHGEEKGVLEATTQSNHPLRAVILINLSEEQIWERWKKIQQQPRNGGMRHDEAKHALEMRLAEYRIKTLPVIDFYREKEMLIEVNGNQPSEQVFVEIIKKLYERAQKDTNTG